MVVVQPHVLLVQLLLLLVVCVVVWLQVMIVSMAGVPPCRQ